MENRIGKLERIWEARDKEKRRTKRSDERLKGERERDRKRGQRGAEGIRNRIRRRKNEENGGGKWERRMALVSLRNMEEKRKV